MARIHVDRPPTYKVDPGGDVAAPELAPAGKDAQAGASSQAEDYGSRTVVELRELLKARDLPVSGSKAELVERLEDDDLEGRR